MTHVIIPSLARHYPIVSISIAILSEYDSNSKFTIVTPDINFYSATNLSTNYSVVLCSDSAIEPISRDAIFSSLHPSIKAQAAWFYQQFLKYQCVLDCDTEKVLILDADTVLLFNPFDSPNTFYYTREQNLPYYAMVEQLFGYRPVLEYSCIANFMVFCPSALSSLVEEIEYRHKKTWPYAIISILNSNPLDFNFSEYETYSNWLATNSPPVTLRPLRIFRRGDLLLKSSNYLDVVKYLALKRYHCVAFEHTHSCSASKKIAARLISFFGLRAW